MNNIFWLGGTPGGGKTATAHYICKKYGFNCYSCDDYLKKHIRLGSNIGKTVCKYLQHSPIIHQDTEKSVKLTVELYKEIFEYILKDIDALKYPLLIEGCSLLPELLAKRQINPQNIFYLFPTDTFYLKVFNSRFNMIAEFEYLTEPLPFVEYWNKRDMLFSKNMIANTDQYNYKKQIIDGKISIPSIAAIIAKHFRI